MRGKSEEATLNGFLDRGSHLTGDLKFEDGFRIDGKFEGKITAGSDLVIGENADVEADIKVERLTVNGSLKGNARRDRSDRASSEGPGPRGSDDAQPRDPGGRLLPGVLQDGNGNAVERRRDAGAGGRR